MNYGVYMALTVDVPITVHKRPYHFNKKPWTKTAYINRPYDVGIKAKKMVLLEGWTLGITIYDFKRKGYTDRDCHVYIAHDKKDYFSEFTTLYLGPDFFELFDNLILKAYKTCHN